MSDVPRQARGYDVVSAIESRRLLPAQNAQKLDVQSREERDREIEHDAFKRSANYRPKKFPQGRA